MMENISENQNISNNGEDHVASVEEENGGELVVSPNVISSIASREVAQVDGIVGLEDTFIADIMAMVKGGGQPKGVRVDLKDGKVTLDLKVNVRYGVHIPPAIIEMRKRVQDAIKQMTGYKVTAINIVVNRVFLEDEKSSEVLERLTNQAGVVDKDVEFR